MTPAEQYMFLQSDTSGIEDLTRPEKLAPILGATGGLLLAVNARSGLGKSLGVLLTVGSLYYGILTKPSTA